MDKHCRICHNTSCSNHGKNISFLGDGWKCNYIPVHTNADRIRAMSDEELATFISEIADECERNTECNQHCYGCDIEYCVRESCLKWLQQPVEEDDHETS